MKGSPLYTAEEVRRILNAVDRSTPWGKTAYLMMLLACVYGLRSSDIKSLALNDINWKSRKITITQYKTHREVSLPLTEETLFALLDYIKVSVKLPVSFRRIILHL